MAPPTHGGGEIWPDGLAEHGWTRDRARLHRLDRPNDRTDRLCGCSSQASDCESFQPPGLLKTLVLGAIVARRLSLGGEEVRCCGAFPGLLTVELSQNETSVPSTEGTMINMGWGDNDVECGIFGSSGRTCLRQQVQAA